jgi:quinol monooxygenase YgiN
MHVVLEKLEDSRIQSNSRQSLREVNVSIYRIGETQAKPEAVEELHEFLLSIMPGIKASPGCESVQLYQSPDDRTKFMMIEVWDSKESHQASVKEIPAELIAKIRPLLASAPSGAYFDMVDQK